MKNTNKKLIWIVAMEIAHKQAKHFAISSCIIYQSYELKLSVSESSLGSPFLVLILDPFDSSRSSTLHLLGTHYSSSFSLVSTHNCCSFGLVHTSSHLLAASTALLHFLILILVTAKPSIPPLVRPTWSLAHFLLAFKTFQFIRICVVAC
ncbi:hypothetical protein V8G54_022991 [Vigna mungo]|uniref:Uncharacterized protein n=1 Tax=Vigna mungo TaxID=3915 RepID=A0AAQ3N464_VIGMU